MRKCILRFLQAQIYCARAHAIGNLLSPIHIIPVKLVYRRVLPWCPYLLYAYRHLCCACNDDMVRSIADLVADYVRTTCNKNCSPVLVGSNDTLEMCLFCTRHVGHTAVSRWSPEHRQGESNLLMTQRGSAVSGCSGIEKLPGSRTSKPRGLSVSGCRAPGYIAKRSHREASCE